MRRSAGVGPAKVWQAVGNRARRVEGARLPVIVAALLVVALAACSRSEPPPTQTVARTVDPKTGTSASPRLYTDGRAIPKGGGTYKVGAPYQISGRWYTPQEDPGYDRTGVASWYGDDFHGRKTANGEIYDMRGLSAAHPTLPMPSYVWVTNENNGRTLLVRVNDRGPYAHDRVIDLSRVTARALDFEGRGLSRVRVRYAGPAPLNGDDRREQAHLQGQTWYRGAPPPQVAERTVPAASKSWWQRPWGLGFGAAEPASEPAAKPVPPPARKSAAKGQKVVVAGVFRSEANARRRLTEVERFVAAGVHPVTGAGGTLYRVRSSPLDEAAALRLKERLAEAGIVDTRIAAE